MNDRQRGLQWHLPDLGQPIQQLKRTTQQLCWRATFQRN